MKKNRIKDYIKVIKTMKKNGGSFGLQFAKDPETGRVYFCNGHGVLSISETLYDAILETDANALKDAKENKSNLAMFSKFITDFENAETVAGYKSAFLLQTFDHLCNIVKSINAAGDAVFTVVNSVYFELLETVAGYSCGFSVSKVDGQKSPVFSYDIETGATLAFLPVHSPELQETVRAAFDL